MATKYNDRRSGPEGSFWWYDWLGNLDDRAEIRAHGSTYPTYAEGYAALEASSLAAGVTAGAAANESAYIILGLSPYCFNSDGTIIGDAHKHMPTINIPIWFVSTYAHAIAADGGAQAVEAGATAGGGPDPYSVHLGYWKANTSTELAGSQTAQTNYGGEGRVWQTFQTDIAGAGPQLRRSSTFQTQARVFGVEYDDKELTGFQNRFGAPTGDTYISIMDDVITSMASEIEVTALSSQPIFNEIVLDKGFDYNKRSFLSVEEEAQSGIGSDLSFVSASAPTNGGYQ